MSWIHEVAADRSIIGSVLSFWTNFRTVANQNETSVKLYKGLLSEFFGGKKSPYLDNEFLLLARTKQDSPKKQHKNVLHSLTSSQIWLIAFVEDCQSTNLAKLKKPTLLRAQ